MHHVFSGYLCLDRRGWFCKSSRLQVQWTCWWVQRTPSARFSPWPPQPAMSRRGGGGGGQGWSAATLPQLKHYPWCSREHRPVGQGPPPVPRARWGDLISLLQSQSGNKQMLVIVGTHFDRDAWRGIIPKSRKRYICSLLRALEDAAASSLTFLWMRASQVTKCNSAGPRYT